MLSKEGEYSTVNPILPLIKPQTIMVKFTQLIVCAWTLAILLPMGVHAQTKLWGVGASAGQMEGAFQNSFAQSTTPGAYGPATWTALHVSQTSGSPSTYWTRSMLGYSQGNFIGQNPTPIPSPSQSDGVAIFDSDYMDNNGTPNIGSGTSVAPHRGELISPRIDLSGNSNTPLVIQFFSEYREFDITELSVSMSTDDGVTWSSPVDYRAYQSSSSPGMIRVPMHSITNSVTNLTQCRIRFTFDGNYYYAMIDDVTLEVAPLYDVAMGRSNSASQLLTGQGDFVKIGGNRYQSLNNIDLNDLSRWSWGGKVNNYGVNAFYPEDSLRMVVAINFFDDVNLPIQNVYLDTIFIDTLLSQNENFYLEYLDDLNFINLTIPGRYEVSYWLEHKHSDADPSNDTVFHVFNTTAGNDNYLSKARRALSDGSVFATRGIFPGGSPYVGFEYGSVFHFPLANTNTLFIDSVEFRYYIPNGYTGNSTETIYFNIYQVNDGGGSTPANGNVDEDELTLIGLQSVTLNGLGTVVTPGSFGLTGIKGFIDISDPLGGSLGILDNQGVYYITVQYEPSLTGGSSSINAFNSIWFGVDAYNYNHNTLFRGPDTIINPSPLRIKELNGTSSFFWTGFGANTVPSLGLYLSQPSSISPLPNNSNTQLNIFPNPTSNMLQVDIELLETMDVQYLITDVSGRVLHWSNHENISKQQTQINVTHLPPGVYFLTAQTSKGNTTKRFIKQ